MALCWWLLCSHSAATVTEYCVCTDDDLSTQLPSSVTSAHTLIMLIICVYAVVSG